jgi:hypothetical protein
MRRSALVFAALPLVLASAGCANEAISSPGTAEPAVLELPNQIVGLKVVQENVRASLKDVRRPYVDSVAVFSMREGDLLRATMEVGRFNSLARPKDSKFRGSIVSVVGGAKPVGIRVGEQDVFATTGTKQNIYTWFSDRGFFILGVQEDFPFPRTLLRRLIDLELEL